MTNQDRRGIGQRDWLADSQQRVRRWLPAPTMSLRRPSVMTRPTLGTVMQRRATRTIEGIPMGPIAGRHELPLVLRRPIKTSTSPDPMLTVLSPTELDLEEEAPAAPVVEDAPALTTDTPAATPARPAAEPAGGIVTRVFRRLFSSPAPEALVDAPPENEGGRESGSRDVRVSAAPVAEAPRPSDAPASDAPAPSADRQMTVLRSPAMAPVAATQPREPATATPLSLITRLLPRRDAGEPATDAAPDPRRQTEAASPASPADVPAAPVQPADLSRTKPAEPASAGATVQAAADAPEAPLTLRYAARPVEAEEPPSRPAEAAPATDDEASPALPLASVEAVEMQAAQAAVAGEASHADTPAIARRASFEAAAVPPSAPGLLLRLRRLIRPDAGADTEDPHGAESAAADAPIARGSFSAAVPAAASVATISRSSSDASGTATPGAARGAGGLASQAVAPLAVRARRQAVSQDAASVRPAGSRVAAVESPGLQLEPWTPVFRARSQPMSAQEESQSVSLDAGADDAPSFEQRPDGNVTVSAPAPTYATPAIARAEAPAEARQNTSAAASEDPTKAGVALDQLATQIYDRLRRRLVIERERAGGFGAQWQ